MKLNDFWPIFQTIGGVRHGLRIANGKSFEKIFALKLKRKYPQHQVETNVKVFESNRKSKQHAIDVVSIGIIDGRRVVTQWEIKGQRGVSHSVAGAHINDAHKLLLYEEELKQRYNADEVITKIVRRGGASISEHNDSFIITEKLEDYLTLQEINEIDENENKIVELLVKHAKINKFDINDDIIDAQFEAMKNWFKDACNMHHEQLKTKRNRK